MRIRTKELIQKLTPYHVDMFAKVHNRELLNKEFIRRVEKRYKVLQACDNFRDYYPIATIPEYDWRDDRAVLMPKRWRIPRLVFEVHINSEGEAMQYICYHIIRHKDGLKLVRLKNGYYEGEQEAKRK